MVGKLVDKWGSQRVDLLGRRLGPYLGVGSAALMVDWKDLKMVRSKAEQMVYGLAVQMEILMVVKTALLRAGLKAHRLAY